MLIFYQHFANVGRRSVFAYFDKVNILPDFKPFVTVSYEAKIQRTLTKTKLRFTLQEYHKVYPTGSNAGKLYGTAKIHKLPESGTADQLPLRPIVSNTGSASYYLAKNLAKILAPLSKSDYTVQNATDFVSFIKPQKIPSNHQLISFDVVSLFTKVPIDATIDIIIRIIYEFKEIDTRSTKNEMKELILLRTKNVHFTFNGEMFTKVDGVAMGSPLLINIFMVQLRRNLIPILKDHLPCWKAMLTTPFVSSKMDRLNTYCQHLIISIVPLNLLMKQKVVTSYHS